MVRSFDATVRATRAGNYRPVARVGHEESYIGEPVTSRGIDIGYIVVENEESVCELAAGKTRELVIIERFLLKAEVVTYSAEEALQSSLAYHLSTCSLTGRQR